MFSGFHNKHKYLKSPNSRPSSQRTVYEKGWTIYLRSLEVFLTGQQIWKFCGRKCSYHIKHSVVLIEFFLGASWDLWICLSSYALKEKDATNYCQPLYSFNFFSLCKLKIMFFFMELLLYMYKLVILISMVSTMFLLVLHQPKSISLRLLQSSTVGPVSVSSLGAWVYKVTHRIFTYIA